MSLVSDALRKAQREAAEREARERGLAPPPGGPPLQPFRRKRRSGAPTATLAAAAVAAGVLALAGIAFFFFSADSVEGGATRSNGAPPRVAEKAAVKGEAASEVGGAPRTDVDSARNPSEADDGRSGDAPDRQATTADPSPLSQPASAIERSGAPPDRQATAADPTPPSLPASADERSGAAPDRQATTRKRTYVRETPPGEGAVIRLGGIAFSERAPLAYLNGKLIGVGERVEDWTVRAIERDQVELARGDERIQINLR